MQNENRQQFPFGNKEAQNFVQHVNVGAGTEMPEGLLSMTPLNADPHQGGPRTPNGPFMPVDSRPPRGAPTEMRPPHDPDPHPATPAAVKQEPNTYGLSRVRR